MAVNYVYGIKSVKYGTPTGSNTMPATDLMTALPYTVKGSVNIDEAEGTTDKFWVDQLSTPIRIVKTEEGEVTATMQFYDLSYPTIAVLKGGTGNASGWTPATGYTQIQLALQIETDNSQVFDFYNAAISSRFTGGASRNAMMVMDVKAVPQISTDLAGAYKLRPV